MNILDDTNEHKPPTLVEKKPDDFNLTLSDSGEDGHFMDDESVIVSVEKDQHKDVIKIDPDKKLSNKKPSVKPFPKIKGRGRGGKGRGRGRGGREYMKGGRGRGRGSGGRAYHDVRYSNDNNPPKYPQPNHWNKPNSINHSQYHDNSVAYSNGDRYHDDNYSNKHNYDHHNAHQNYGGNDYDCRMSVPDSSHGYNKRKCNNTDQSKTLSLVFNGAVKSVKLINSNDLVKFNNDSFLKVGSKLIRLTLNSKWEYVC